MAEFYYNDAGTWRKAKEIYYNEAGTQRKAKECWYKDGATWRKVFSGVVINSHTSDLVNTGFTAGTYLANIQLNSDGTTSGSHASSTANWTTPTTTGIGANYWVRVTTSGATFVTYGGSLTVGAAPVSLSSNQSFSVANSGTSAESTGSYTITIYSDSSGLSPVGSVSGSWDVGRVL